MLSFTILEHGREPGKPQRYARCLYGDHDAEVTVIIGDDVMAQLQRQGVVDFSEIVRSAVEAAQAVDTDPKQIVVLPNTPILDTIIARLRRPRT